MDDLRSKLSFQNIIEIKCTESDKIDKEYFLQLL